MSIGTYQALALQVRCDAVNLAKDAESARAQMMQTIQRCNDLIKGSIGFSAGFSGLPVRLVVLPEYFLTSFPMGEPIPAWIEKACLQMDGPE